MRFGKVTNVVICSFNAFVVALLLTGVVALLAGVSLVPKTSTNAPNSLPGGTIAPLDGKVSPHYIYAHSDAHHDLSCLPHTDLQLHNEGINANSLPCDKTSVARSASISDRYTIVCNTFRRPKLLKKSIRHYTKCPNVQDFIIVWSDTENEPYDFLSKGKEVNGKGVHVVKFDKNLLSNQFKVHDEVKTSAVLNIDDDVTIKCDDLEFAFKTWKLHQDRMVGFFPRATSCKNSRGNLDYHSGNPNHHALSIGYRLVLTKAAFYHKKFHKKYFQVAPREVLSHVDETMNCEDLAFSFVHANITGLTPIWIRTIDKIRDVIKGNAISKKRGHAKARDHCIDKFRKAFGHLPNLTSVHLTRCSDKLPWDWAKRSLEQTPTRAPILNSYPPFAPEFNQRVQNYLDFAPRLPINVQDRIPSLIDNFLAELQESPASTMRPTLAATVVVLVSLWLMLM